VLVALKVAHAGGSLAELQLEREAQVLKALGAPTVPMPYEEGLTRDGHPYLAMEFLPLPTLASRLAQLSGPMPLDEFSSRARALTEALEMLHSRGFAHCDLTPENLFLDDTASRVRLVDFGLAHPLAEGSAASEEPSPKQGSTYAGTAEYMAPEQCAGSPVLDARTDVYALGVLLYEMLTGRPPFSGAHAEVLQAHLSRRPPPLSELTPVSPGLEALVLQCLAKERFRRFDSVVAVRGALREALSEKKQSREPSARGAPTEEHARTPQARRSVAVLLFSSSANPMAIQKVLTGLGGQVAYRDGVRFAGVFDPNAGENPVRRALRAAEELEEHSLVSTALVDVATVTVQQRPGAPPRYLGSIFTRKERYPATLDTTPLLLTPAAADAVPDVRCVPLPERGGLLRLASPEVEPRADITVLRLGSGVLVGRDEELQGLWETARAAAEHRAPTLITVLGERGHGKSHFGAALARRLREGLPQAGVYSVRAREPVQGDPSSTLRMLLRLALHAFERDETGTAEQGRAAFFERLGPELATELWPGVAATLGWSALDSPELQSRAAAPGALRSLALRAMGKLLTAIARKRPLFLLVDDAHFADETAL
jgi:hypothetical protein